MSDEIVEGQIVPSRGHAIVLGSAELHTPAEVIEHGAEIAGVLKDVVMRQHLYSMIQGKEYVRVEGWNALGALLGVLPKEDWVKSLDNDRGFEAKVLLVRASDGVEIGGASAMVTRDEKSWANRDEYALRSMAITRATGKAYRLAFSWIMHLAGYEVTPAEEMPPVEEERPRSRPQSGPRPKAPAPSTISGTPGASPKTDRQDNQWEPEILTKVVDLQLADSSYQAVKVLEYSPFTELPFGELDMVQAVAWFICWLTVKEAHPKMRGAERSGIAHGAWTLIDNRTQWIARAREKLGMVPDGQ